MVYTFFNFLSDIIISGNGKYVEKYRSHLLISFLRFPSRKKLLSIFFATFSILIRMFLKNQTAIFAILFSPPFSKTRSLSIKSPIGKNKNRYQKLQTLTLEHSGKSF